MAKAKDEADYIVVAPDGDTQFDFSSLADAKKAAAQAAVDYAHCGNHPDDCIATIYRQVSAVHLKTVFEDG